MKKRILIVEDNQVLAENYACILSNDYDLMIANSALEAIEIIDEKLPDAMILDILLGKYSIFSLLNELSSYPDTMKIPAIICSDMAEGLNERMLANFSVQKVFEKSKMTPEDLQRSLRRILNEN